MTGADRETFCIDEFTVEAVVFGVGMPGTLTVIPVNTLFTCEGSFTKEMCRWGRPCQESTVSNIPLLERAPSFIRNPPYIGFVTRPCASERGCVFINPLFLLSSWYTGIRWPALWIPIVRTKEGTFLLPLWCLSLSSAVEQVSVW